MVNQMSAIGAVRVKQPRVSLSAFTLIELVVTVAIVGILAAIAYPAYVNQVIKGNRSAAQQFMLDIANAQAQYQIDARAYSNVIGAGGLGLAPTTAAASNYTFAIALSAGPPPGYVITATPIGRQAQDNALTMDSAGIKSPASKW
jgi:type IV pilus assembly protein PilE